MEEGQKKRLYQLADAESRRRLAELSGHEQIKSLRDEVSLIRMLIENTWNAAKTDAQKEIACGSLNRMLITAEKLIRSCHALEKEMGELLSKEAVYRVAQTMCQIVIEELQGIDGHEEIIDRIHDRLFPAIRRIQNTEPVPATVLQIAPPEPAMVPAE